MVGGGGSIVRHTFDVQYLGDIPVCLSLVYTTLLVFWYR